MLMKFTTKRDRNGNRYTLIIDTEAKTIKKDFNPFYSGDYIEITRTDRRRLFDEAIKSGFKSIEQ